MTIDDGGLDQALAGARLLTDHSRKSLTRDPAGVAYERAQASALARVANAINAFLCRSKAVGLMPDIVDAAAASESPNPRRWRHRGPHATDGIASCACYVLITPVGGIDLAHDGLVVLKSASLTSAGSAPH